MDHDNAVFQSQNFQLAGEDNSIFSSGLQPFALPKLDVGPVAMGGAVVCAHIMCSSRSWPSPGCHTCSHALPNVGWYSLCVCVCFAREPAPRVILRGSVLS
jgi:hypothetical protein